MGSCYLKKKERESFRHRLCGTVAACVLGAITFHKVPNNGKWTCWSCFLANTFSVFLHLTSWLRHLCTCLPPIPPPFPSVYLFQSWWVSCQACSCLMRMGTYSIRPAATRKLEGEKEGFIWGGRPSCYRPANRNGSAAPAVLSPDNVPSYSRLCMNGTDQSHYMAVLPLWILSPKKVVFPHNNLQECFHQPVIFHTLPRIIHFCSFQNTYSTFIEEKEVPTFDFPHRCCCMSMLCAVCVCVCVCVCVLSLMGNLVRCLANHVWHLYHRGPESLGAIPVCPHECKAGI